MKWTSCEMKTSVPAYCLRAETSASMERMSRWVVGSSMRRRLGGSTRNLTRLRRDFSPPERTRMRFMTSFLRNRKEPRMERASSSRSSPLDAMTSSRTVFDSFMDRARCWEKYPILVAYPTFTSPPWISR